MAEGVGHVTHESWQGPGIRGALGTEQGDLLHAGYKTKYKRGVHKSKMYEIGTGWKLIE